MDSMFSNLLRLKDARTGRVSSMDRRGKNNDYWMIPAGESIVLGDIEGPGCITHIWMTSFCRRTAAPSVIPPELNGRCAPVNEIHPALGIVWDAYDPDYYRKALIKITWDDQSCPSVLAPFGDFFCVGHSLPGNFSSLPFNVSVKPEESKKFGAPASLSCYFPMPFNKRAKIEIINENDVPFGLYFHIDFDLYKEPVDPETPYFHAMWRRELPCDGWGNSLQVNSPEVNSVSDLTGENNYVVLDTKGKGHFVGCNLSVLHFQGSWWGEGNDMIFIDDEETPSIKGTGCEDYFNHAWGMQKSAFPFFGSIIHESDMPGYQVSYRFHVTDPIRFQKSIRVTLEHGHANQLSDDWSSTAYWYQTLPTAPFGILPVEQRLPLIASIRKPEPKGDIALTDEMEKAVADTQSRLKTYLEEKDKVLVEKTAWARACSVENIEHAKEIRRRFER